MSDLVVYSEGMSGWNERSDGGMMNALLWSKSAAGREARAARPSSGFRPAAPLRATGPLGVEPPRRSPRSSRGAMAEMSTGLSATGVQPHRAAQAHGAAAGATAEKVPTPLDLVGLSGDAAGGLTALTPSQLLDSMRGLEAFVDGRRPTNIIQ